MKLIIDKEYTRYGGDHDNILYLDISASGSSMHLGLEVVSDSVTTHLTSDTDYMNWLRKHKDSLLLISENKWYQCPDRTDGGKYHFEFYYTLNKLAKMTKLLIN
jgi:hypothetical protein